MQYSNSTSRSVTFRTAAILILFSTAICFTHIHQGHLSGDAIRYATIAKNILRSGDWLVLRDTYGQVEAYHNKPHFLFWLLAIDFQLFGYHTFTAKLPSACFVFLALLLLWYAARTLRNQKCAFLAVFLFSLNRTFGRDVLDLNVEGMALCGALLVFYGGLLIALTTETVQSPRTRAFRIGSIIGFGTLLLSQSKTPYVVLTLVPVMGMLFFHRERRSTLRYSPFWLGIAIPLTLIVVWYGLLGRQYLQGALDNQWVNPIRANASYTHNLLSWAKAILVSWAPMSVFGLLGMYRVCRFDWPPLDKSVRTLLLLWLLTTIPIVILVDCRPRYVIIPMVAMSLFGAIALEQILVRMSQQRVESLALAVGIGCFLLFSAAQLQIHRTNYLAHTAITEFLERGMRPPVLCYGTRDVVEKSVKARSTALLLDLETSQSIPVHTAEQVAEQLPSTVLANSGCTELLEEAEVAFTIEKKFKKVALLRIEQAKRPPFLDSPLS